MDLLISSIHNNNQNNNNNNNNSILKTKLYRICELSNEHEIYTDLESLKYL